MRCHACNLALTPRAGSEVGLLLVCVLQKHWPFNSYYVTIMISQGVVGHRSGDASSSSGGDAAGCYESGESSRGCASQLLKRVTSAQVTTIHAVVAFESASAKCSDEQNTCYKCLP
jgi:hypothetical protein